MSRFLDLVGDHAGPLTYAQVDDTATNSVWKNTRTSKNDATDADDVTVLSAVDQDAAQLILYNDMQKLIAKKTGEEKRLGETNREIAAMTLILGNWEPPSDGV